MDNTTYEGVFAEKLRTLFNESKKTQMELILYIKERTGRAPTRQAVSMWLRGNSPDIKTIPIIANFFGVSVDYLITDTNIRTTNTDLKAVCEYIGLSEKAVESLDMVKKYGNPALTETINFILEDMHGALSNVIETFSSTAGEEMNSHDDGIMLIAKLQKYFNCPRLNGRISITNSGRIIDLGDTTKPHFAHMTYEDMISLEEIAPSDIVEKFLFDKVCDAIKQAKEVYRSKTKDGDPNG